MLAMDNGSLLTQSYWPNVALTANRDGTAIHVGRIIGWSMSVHFSGNFNGVFKMQFSNDPVDSQDDVTNWITIPGTSATITAGLSTGGEANVGWNFGGEYYKFIRLIYVHTSGSGTLTAANYTLKGP